MSEDPITGLHRRFDNLESNFKSIQEEQHKMAINLMAVDKRIDLVEIQIKSAEQREILIVKAVEQKLEQNSAMIKKLFEKFDRHSHGEEEDRKKLLFWLGTTVISVLGTAGFILFNKVFNI